MELNKLLIDYEPQKSNHLDYKCCIVSGISIKCFKI